MREIHFLKLSFTEYKLLCNQLEKSLYAVVCLPFVLLRVHSFLFSNLGSGVVDSGEVRPEDMLGSEVSDTHFG